MQREDNELKGGHLLQSPQAPAGSSPGGGSRKGRRLSRGSASSLRNMIDNFDVIDPSLLTSDLRALPPNPLPEHLRPADPSEPRSRPLSPSVSRSSPGALDSFEQANFPALLMLKKRNARIGPKVHAQETQARESGSPQTTPSVYSDRDAIHRLGKSVTSSTPGSHGSSDFANRSLSMRPTAPMLEVDVDHFASEPTSLRLPDPDDPSRVPRMSMPAPHSLAPPGSTLDDQDPSTEIAWGATKPMLASWSPQKNFERRQLPSNAPNRGPSALHLAEYPAPSPIGGGQASAQFRRFGRADEEHGGSDSGLVMAGSPKVPSFVGSLASGASGGGSMSYLGSSPVRHNGWVEGMQKRQKAAGGLATVSMGSELPASLAQFPAPQGPSVSVPASSPHARAPDHLRASDSFGGLSSALDSLQKLRVGSATAAEGTSPRAKVQVRPMPLPDSTATTASYMRASQDQTKVPGASDSLELDDF